MFRYWDQNMPKSLYQKLLKQWMIYMFYVIWGSINKQFALKCSLYNTITVFFGDFHDVFILKSRSLFFAVKRKHFLKLKFHYIHKLKNWSSNYCTKLAEEIL